MYRVEYRIAGYSATAARPALSKPGASVMVNISALGAEDSRFESAAPDKKKGRDSPSSAGHPTRRPVG